MNKLTKTGNQPVNTMTTMSDKGQNFSWTKRPSLTSHSPKTRRAKSRFYH